MLEIEYIKSVAPRKQEDPSLHDDWVSSVDGSNRFILTGCYDGLGRIWEAAGVCTHVLEGHNDAVTSVRVVKEIEDDNDTNPVVATGSKDKTVKLWKFDAEPEADNLKIRAYRTLRGHTASVQSLAAPPSGDMVRAGIIGYPNVGKSSLINRLLKRRMCPAAPREGVTRVLNDLELLDSPGIIPMRMSDQSAAIKLAVCDDIGERSYNFTDVVGILVQMLSRLRGAILPDFAQVYGFIGSVFDPHTSGHLQKLKKMDPVDVETVCLRTINN